MRRIRAATILSSFCAAVDGGRAAAAAFSTANPKPKPHTKPPSDIFGVFVRNQLKNEGRARKILFREYGGRATKDEDDELADEEKVNSRKVPFSQEEFNAFIEYESDFEIYEGDEYDEDKVAQMYTRILSEDELDAFVTNLRIECQADYEKFIIVNNEFHKLLENVKEDDESGEVTQNDRVDKLAEIAAEEELDALITNSFVTNLMIECEPKYEKRFREIIEKVRKKMIQDDGILEAFQLVTNLMSKCDPDYEKLLGEVLEKIVEKVRKKMIQDHGIPEPFEFVSNLMSKFEPEYEQLLCEVLEKVREKITQDDKGGNDNTSKIVKFARLGMNEGKLCSFEEKLDEFVTNALLTNLRSVEEKNSCFMAYEVIEKVAKKLGNENVCKIADEKLDALVTDSFLCQTVGVHTNMTYFKNLKLWKSRSRRARRGRRELEECFVEIIQ